MEKISIYNYSSGKIMKELIGNLLQDRYQIESLLGRQTGRRTFLAIDTQTNNSVVIKILLFGPDFTWDDLKLFEREAEVLKSLDYPAIPKYLNFFDVELEWGKGFALVQSHIDAQSLQQWIQAGRTFSEDDLKSIATDLLKILEYLHGRQPAVIHRDIKPSNILLTDRTAHSPGQVYLVDFGSVQTAVKDGTRTIIGTYGYMPPEQFGGQTSPASDLYALGATLIYLATGQHPSELPKKEMRILFEPQVRLRNDLIAWLKGLTAPILEKRFDSTQQALAALYQPNSLNLSSSLELGTKLKPIRSKVRIEKTAKILTIMIPNRYKFWGFIIFLIPTVVITPIMLLLLMVSSPALSAIGLGLFILLFRKLEIVLTEQERSFHHSLSSRRSNGRYESIEIQRQDIIRIELIEYYHYDTVKRESFKILTINIWDGFKNFQFGENLTRQELEWLAQECSMFLNLPINYSRKHSLDTYT
jgi:serine/threonine protein kinase